MNKLNTFIVYKHTNKINNKAYIGITCRTLEERCGKNGHNYHGSKVFYYAIQKYGWDNFSHEILESNLSQHEAREKEKYYILLYNTYIYFDNAQGYNMTIGGEMPYSLNKIAVWKDEVRKYISKDLLEEYIANGWTQDNPDKNPNKFKEEYQRRKDKNYFENYTEEHKEEIKAYKQKYFQEHHEELVAKKRAYLKEYAKTHKEQLKLYKQNYKKKHQK